MGKELTLAAILKNAREKKGLLLRQVAAMIDSDTALISKFEKNERKPTREQIIKLAKSLDIDEEKLFTLFLSERLIRDLRTEAYAEKALKMAHKKIKELKKL